MKATSYTIPCQGCKTPIPTSRQFCDSCLSIGISKRNSNLREKYKTTPEIDETIKSIYQSIAYRSKATKVLMQRLGWSRSAVVLRAAELGVGKAYKTADRWHEREIDVLDKFSYLKLHSIQRRLKIECGTHRTIGAIAGQLHRKRIRDVTNKEWWTPSELAGLLGFHHQKVLRFIAEGKIKATERKMKRYNYIIHHKDAETFVLRHSKEINLCKVDRSWFLLLVSGGKIIE